MRDLVETLTTSEIPLALWYDEDTHEIGLQYGYVVLSLPLEDFYDLGEALLKAQDELER